jgi:hypothetical protein
MHVTVERLLSFERPLANYIKYHLIIISIVCISDNVMVTGEFLLGVIMWKLKIFLNIV